MSSTDLKLKSLDREYAIYEKRLPFTKRWFKRIFSVRGQAIKQIGEYQGWGLSILAFWSVPAKVWAGGIWNHATDAAVGVMSLLKVGVDVT